MQGPAQKYFTNWKNIYIKYIPHNRKVVMYNTIFTVYKKKVHSSQSHPDKVSCYSQWVLFIDGDAA